MVLIHVYNVIMDVVAVGHAADISSLRLSHTQDFNFPLVTYGMAIFLIIHIENIRL